MKILVIGGTGTIGTAVASILKEQHEVIIAGFKGGDIQVDISNASSIENLYKKIGPIDAVASCAGKVTFAPFEKMTEEMFEVGLKNKLMGQINIVRIGCSYVRKGGSFTLISGILNVDPIYQGTSAAIVNGAIDSFVLSSRYELKDHRINAVSPTVVSESMDKYGSFFHGYKPVDVSEVALAFYKCIEGIQTGKIIRVGYSV